MSHIEFMQAALEQAELAAAKGEVPVGAVIVNEQSIISKAHNLIESTYDSTAHAEILAIKEASKKLKRWRLEDCSIYVNLEPCTMCIGAIRAARISAVYFSCFDEKFGACGSLYDLSGETELYPDLIGDESRALLSKFFKKLR